jgi:predicted MFS family arabinose efflux permease
MPSLPEGPALPLPPATERSALVLALALSLGAAVSLGITRFAYGLLLPPMRLDLGWTYTLAGAMNTFNAMGYLLGALSTPWLMRRLGPERLLLLGSVLASLFMAGSGFFVDATPLMVQRLLAGWASAWVFIAGGLLAARLGVHWPHRSGLLLGLYYGGTGWGIVASAVSVPWVLQAMAARSHAWVWAWWWLAGLCGLATWVLAWVAKALQHQNMRAANAAGASSASGVGAPLPPSSLWRLTPALAGYSLFGVGYIGYMTFVIALLRDQGHSGAAITFFYSLLGLAVVASSRIWAGLLDRYKNGQPLARLNALLGVATVMPALTSWWPVLLLSGLMFGGVFLSVVASTTALVRHNLPVARWAAGISAFTIVFAAGQIVGPTVVGWIADGPGGLARGLLFSAVALWLGAALAWRQKALV